MSFGIVWVPVDPATRVAHALGEPCAVSLPHLVDRPDADQSGVALHAELTPRSLLFGILMTDDEASPFVDCVPSRPQLQGLLLLLVQHFKSASIDELCANAAVYLRDAYGVDAAITALRRANDLVLDGVLCRGDLIASLFMRATTTRSMDEGSADLEEVVAVFSAWRRRSTSTCENQEFVFYCGLASLTYLARAGERDRIVATDQRLAACSPWLAEELVRLKHVAPGHLADIAVATEA